MHHGIWIAAFILLASCARELPRPTAVSWDARTSTFSWSGGQVNLPSGFTHHRDVGCDTDTGHFSSPDARHTIEYDIGGYAGHYAGSQNAIRFRETTVDGARVWVASSSRPASNGRHTTLVAVTFPDSGSANFFVESDRPEDAETIDLIARSFRPKRPPAP